MGAQIKFGWICLLLRASSARNLMADQVHNSARVIGLLGPLKYYACLTKGGDDGSYQEAHIRPEGRTDAQAPRGGTKSSSNPQATGDGSQGRSYTEEE